MITRIKKSWIILALFLISLAMFSVVLIYRLRFDAAQEAANGPLAAPVYEIRDMDDYQEFVNTIHQGNAYAGWQVHLCTDLDFSDMEDFQTAGLTDENILAFAGMFDGQGYTISGIQNDNPDGPAGLFANLTGTVKNLRLEDCAFSGNICGSIAAQATGEAAVLNCELKNVSTGGNTCLIAQEFSGNIWNCITCDSVLTLSLKKGTIEQCYYPDENGRFLLISSEAEDTGTQDSTDVCLALNQNLATISGYYHDMNYQRWTSTDVPNLIDAKADLLQSLTATASFGNQTFSLEGYYSCEDRCWVFAMPAGYQDTALSMTAATSLGHTEQFRRSESEEAVLYTWNDTYYPIRFFSADTIDTLYVTLRADRTLEYVHNHKLEEIPGILAKYRA